MESNTAQPAAIGVNLSAALLRRLLVNIFIQISSYFLIKTIALAYEGFRDTTW
jgi:hypothetical protein